MEAHTRTFVNKVNAKFCMLCCAVLCVLYGRRALGVHVQVVCCARGSFAFHRCTCGAHARASTCSISMHTYSYRRRGSNACVLTHGCTVLGHTRAINTYSVYNIKSFVCVVCAVKESRRVRVWRIVCVRNSRISSLPLSGDDVLISGQ